MINYFAVLLVILLSSITTAIDFGFKICDSSVDGAADSHSAFDIIYQWGQARYECQVDLVSTSIGTYNTWWTCDTNTLTATNCGTEYFLEINAADISGIDDVCVEQIMVQGTTVNVVPKRIGDNADGGPNPDSHSFIPYRYYELPGAPDTLPTLGTSHEVNIDEPVCDPVTASSGSCNASAISTFDWDILTEQGPVVAGVSAPVVTRFEVDESDLSLNIEVELEYFGKATADDQDEANFGVTYVLDFEDFNAHKDAISEPGTCQNRNGDDFGGHFGSFWNYSSNPSDDIGTSDYLAYPPPDSIYGEWDVFMKDGEECDTVIYNASFTWNDLRNCKKYNSIGKPYTDVVTDDNWLNMTGTFYINLVSPYWYNQDFGYYRVYQLLSQPFVIAVSSVVHVLGSTGINVMTMSVIAVYKQDEGPNPLSSRNYYGDFRLVLLTECSDYLKLTRVDSDPFTFNAAASADVDQSVFTIEVNPENNDCLNNKGFICSQLWQINATNVACTDSSGTDFSGNYALTFTPQCRSASELGGDAEAISLNAYCDQWLIDHPQLTTGTRVALDTDLVWKDDICDPLVFIVRLEAEMEFYEDASFAAPVADNHLYQVGEDIIYVEVTTDFPSDTMDVLDVELIEVHICTFDPLLNPEADYNDPVDDFANFGCMNSNRDTGYDQYFYKIFEADSSDHTGPPLISLFDFTEYQNGVSNTERFSFKVPEEVARDRLFVQVELEVELQEIDGAPTRRRRRMLLSSQTEPTANKLGHFVQGIGINYGQDNINKEPRYEQPKYNEPNNNYNPPEQYYPPQQPLINPISNPSSYTINLSSPWIIAIGGLLGVILTFNIIFMTYRNCCGSIEGGGRVSFGKRKGYAKVDVDSEFDSEAQMIPNEDNQ